MKWVGVRLAKVANYYYRIDYCRHDNCYWVRQNQMLKIQYKQVEVHMKCLEEKLIEFNSYNSQPRLFITDFNADMLAEKVYVSESELMNARIHEYEALRYGDIPLPTSMQTDYILEEAKEHCLKGLFSKVKNYVSFDTQKDDYKGGVYIICSVVVGRKKEKGNGIK